MPISRYEIRNEYSLADPELYRAADKDDPEALLEGVAMAGLVGVLRQLGDLAEFAAEIFHDLHEEVMATAARGHGLTARVQQLEAEVPLIEKAFLSQTNHSSFFYSPGVDWHPDLRIDQNLITRQDLPRFVMDSYEECRGPPRLFLLDKFDVAGAGACLKRYTDPSFFKVESLSSGKPNVDVQREKKTRKAKRKGSRWRNRETPEVLPTSHAKLHQLFLEERVENGITDPARRVKLKRRLNGFPFDSRTGKSYMEKFLKSSSPEHKEVHEISVGSSPLKLPLNSAAGLDIVEISTVSVEEEFIERGRSPSSSPEIARTVTNTSINEQAELFTENETQEITPDFETHSMLSTLQKMDNEKEVSANGESKREGIIIDYLSDDNMSEIDNYVDALATIESEMDTDSEFRAKSDLNVVNVKRLPSDLDSNEEQSHADSSDNQSEGKSTVSDDGSGSPRKRVSSFFHSDTASTSAENVSVDNDVSAEIPPSADMDEARITGEPSSKHILGAEAPIRQQPDDAASDNDEASSQQCLEVEPPVMEHPKHAASEYACTGGDLEVPRSISDFEEQARTSHVTDISPTNVLPMSTDEIVRDGPLVQPESDETFSNWNELGGLPKDTDGHETNLDKNPTSSLGTPDAQSQIHVAPPILFVEKPGNDDSDDEDLNTGENLPSTSDLHEVASCAGDGVHLAPSENQNVDESDSEDKNLSENLVNTSVSFEVLHQTVDHNPPTLTSETLTEGMDDEEPKLNLNMTFVDSLPGLPSQERGDIRPEVPFLDQHVEEFDSKDLRVSLASLHMPDNLKAASEDRSDYATSDMEPPTENAEVDFAENSADVVVGSPEIGPSHAEEQPLDSIHAELDACSDDVKPDIVVPEIDYSIPTALKGDIAIAPILQGPMSDVSKQPHPTAQEAEVATTLVSPGPISNVCNEPGVSSLTNNKFPLGSVDAQDSNSPQETLDSFQSVRDGQNCGVRTLLSEILENKTADMGSRSPSSRTEVQECPDRMDPVKQPEVAALSDTIKPSHDVAEEDSSLSVDPRELPIEQVFMSSSSSQRGLDSDETYRESGMVTAQGEVTSPELDSDSVVSGIPLSDHSEIVIPENLPDPSLNKENINRSDLHSIVDYSSCEENLLGKENVSFSETNYSDLIEDTSLLPSQHYDKLQILETDVKLPSNQLGELQYVGNENSDFGVFSRSFPAEPPSHPSMSEHLPPISLETNVYEPLENSSPALAPLPEANRSSLEEVDLLPPLPPVPEWRTGKVQQSFPAPPTEEVHANASILSPEVDQETVPLKSCLPHSAAAEESSHSVSDNSIGKMGHSGPSLQVPPMFHHDNVHDNFLFQSETTSTNPCLESPPCDENQQDGLLAEEGKEQLPKLDSLSHTAGDATSAMPTEPLHKEPGKLVEQVKPETSLDDKMSEQSTAKSEGNLTTPGAVMVFPKANELPQLYMPSSEGETAWPAAEDGQPNGRRTLKLPRPRNPLIDAVAAHDKSKLRKVTERIRPQLEKADERDSLLEQIRTKSFSLKPAAVSRPNIQRPHTNLKVAAILEKANQIRQALAGSDEDDDADSWSDS